MNESCIYLTMLTGKQKRFLRALAHHKNPIFQVGKGGVNENMCIQLNKALEDHELLKVSVLKNCDDDPKFVGEQLAYQLDAELVQVIGRTVVLYKESVENKEIKLP